jgi:GNAT superfamily N-acetyltransferase
VIREIGSNRLHEYARVPIAFEVHTVLRVESLSLGFRLVEEPVARPYVKDYDASDDPDGRVLNWPKHFDVSKWGFFTAREGGVDVGAATVAVHTPSVHMLEDRADLAVLWDIRVRPEQRRHGVGAALFRHASNWARSRGCRQLKVETQNTNVPACRFYSSQGCVLGGINRFGYASCPAVAHETMLLWYLDLSRVNENTRSRPAKVRHPALDSRRQPPIIDRPQTKERNRL